MTEPIQVLLAKADRIQQLLDRTELADHKYAYARAADARDAEAMVERFLPDCTAEYSLGEMIEGGPLRIEGREALRAWLGQHLADVVSSSHHLTNVEVTFASPDTATMMARLYSWQRFEQLPDPVDRHTFGRCLDTWVRTPDGWQQSSLGFQLAGAFTSEVPR
jgi:ketosteroid isomerase-like protein